jgi:hypothetical protein
MKRSMLITGGILALVLLLTSATFVGARMLRDSGKAETEDEGSGKVMELMTNDGSGPRSLRLKIEPAPELPDEPTEVNGVLLRRQDNSVFVGTGEIRLGITMDEAGQQSVSLDHSGPEIEVVINHDTLIYCDETDMSIINPGSGKSGEQTIQQVVKAVDSLDEVGDNAEIEVWGERRGDRVVAQVLVYHNMAWFRNPES